VLARCMRVDGDRGAGLRVCAGYRPEHPHYVGGQSLLVDRTFEHASPHARVADALGDVPDEEVDHHVACGAVRGT
jgi:hypothetical protein